MVAIVYFTLALSAFSGVVTAHGFVGAIRANGVDYRGWSPFVDRFEVPQPKRAIRPFRDNGPVDDFTTKEITCNNYPNTALGDNPPAKGNDGSHVVSIPVQPGDKLTILWDSWNIPHPGPVMTYLANCHGNCQNFTGDTGDIWVKIDQLAFDATKDPMWASLLLTKQNATWAVTVPPTLAPGEYIMRHEILGLQAAAVRLGAQFYPSCSHLSVSGTGTQQLPKGVALPGAYDPEDMNGVRVRPYDVESGLVEYIAPGGPVWSEAAPQLNGA